VGAEGAPGPARPADGNMECMTWYADAGVPGRLLVSGGDVEKRA
jgi:hypothetical protein